MATITVKVETPDEVGVVGATIVIGDPISNSIGNGVRLEFDNSAIPDKTTDSNGQATWTVPDDYNGTWLVHILDSDSNRMTLTSPRFYLRSKSYHHLTLHPTGTDRIEGVIKIGADTESATYPYLWEVA